MINFFLKNDKGQEFRLDREQDQILLAPEGLGFKFTNSFSNKDDQFYLITQKKAQSKFSASILFFEDNAYKKYQQFTDFISNSAKLYLYQDFDIKIDNQIPYCEITLEELSKSELEGNVLEIPITLYINSLWLIDKTYSSETLTVGGASFDNAQFNKSTFFYTGIKTLDILNAGQNKVPLIIEIIGTSTNPEVIVTDANGNQNRVKINITTDSSQKLIIDATPFAEKIVVRNANGVETNVYQNLNFKYDSFLFAPVGSASIRFNGGGEFTKMQVRYSLQSLSV